MPQNRGHRRSLGQLLQRARPSTEGIEASESMIDFMEYSFFRTGNARTCKSSGKVADPPALAQCRHRRSTYKDGECSRRGFFHLWPAAVGFHRHAGMPDANYGESRSGPVLRTRVQRGDPSMCQRQLANSLRIDSCSHRKRRRDYVVSRFSTGWPRSSGSFSFEVRRTCRAGRQRCKNHALPMPVIPPTVERVARSMQLGSLSFLWWHRGSRGTGGRIGAGRPSWPLPSSTRDSRPAP
jgi:hypothetical protein